MEDVSLKTPRDIWVNSFDEESAKKFKEAIIDISRADPERPIVIYVDSYGGYVDALATMIEAMDSVPNILITACVGKAMSSGAVLLSHGDIRFCGKHSRVMIHEISSGTSGNVHDMHEDMEEAKRMNRYFMGLLAKNCGYSSYEDLREILKRRDGRDLYMDAKEAQKFGIVDFVGLPSVQTKIIYEIGLVEDKPRNKLVDLDGQNDKRHTPKTVSESRKVKRSIRR